jgi:hypothetical protein
MRNVNMIAILTIKIVTVPIDADDIRVVISLRGVVVTVEEI